MSVQAITRRRLFATPPARGGDRERGKGGVEIGREEKSATEDRARSPGKPHRYFFKLYALDAKLNLKAGSHES